MLCCIFSSTLVHSNLLFSWNVSHIFGGTVPVSPRDRPPIWMSVRLPPSPSHISRSPLVPASVRLPLAWFESAQQTLPLFRLRNVPPLALTKSDCTVTSQAPEPADWLATGSVAGEWKRRVCVCVRVSVGRCGVGVICGGRADGNRRD